MLGIFSRLHAFFKRRQPAAPPVIEATADGFVVRDARGTTVEVRWSAVRRAAAYKRDLLTTDEIIVVFELDAPSQHVIEVAESWPGFAILFEGMERALGVSPDWYMNIMLPVFEQTPTMLYERPNASHESTAASE